MRQWALDQLQGTVGADGTYVAAGSRIGGLRQGDGRRRHRPGARARDSAAAVDLHFDNDKAPMPWWTANLKATIGAIDGNNALVRPRDETVGRRAKIIMGRPEWSNYTIEADVRGIEARRQRGDIGLINQRYVLVLFGNAQKLELHPWQAADEMTVRVPFEWTSNTWYRMKLRVENRADGTTLVRGKVWPTGQPEPAAWTIEKIDRIPHLKGSPGVYGDGISDVQCDNLRVYRNQ